MIFSDAGPSGPASFLISNHRGLLERVFRINLVFLLNLVNLFN
jgi:hypothetical protein